MAGLILACLAVISGDASLGSDWVHGNSIRIATNGRGVTGDNVSAIPSAPPRGRGVAPVSDGATGVLPRPSANARGDVDMVALSSYVAGLKTVADLYKFRDSMIEVFRMTPEVQDLMSARQAALLRERDQSQLFASGNPNEPKLPGTTPKDPKEDPSSDWLGRRKTDEVVSTPVVVKENPTIKDGEPVQPPPPKRDVSSVGGIKTPVAPVSQTSPPTVVGGLSPKAPTPPKPEDWVKALKDKSDQDRRLREDLENRFSQFDTRPSPTGAPARSPASATDDVDEPGHGGEGSAPSEEPPVIAAPTLKAEKIAAEDPSDEGRKRFSEKRTAAIEEAEAALSDPNTPPDLLQSKLDTLLAYAEEDARRGNEDDGWVTRIGSLTPQPVTIINRIEYPNLPASGVKERLVLGGQLGNPKEQGTGEGEDPNAPRRKPGVIIGELLAAREAKALPGTLFPKKKTAPQELAATAAKEPVLAGVAKVSKSLIQSLRDAIAARKGIVRPGHTSDSDPSVMTALASSVGRRVAAAKGKIANLYVSAGFGSSTEGSPLATGVGLLCLFGLASAALVTSRRKRPQVQIKD